MMVLLINFIIYKYPLVVSSATTPHLHPPNKMAKTNANKRAQKKAQKANAVLEISVEEPVEESVKEPVEESAEWDDVSFAEMKTERDELLAKVAELRARQTTIKALIDLMKPCENPRQLESDIKDIVGCANLDFTKCYAPGINWHCEMLICAFKEIDFPIATFREFFGDSKTTVITHDVGTNVGTETEKPSPEPTVPVKPTHVKLPTQSFAAIQATTVSTEVADVADVDEAADVDVAWTTMVKTRAKHDNPVIQPLTESDPPCAPCGTWEQSQFCHWQNCRIENCKFVHIGNNFFMPNMTNTKRCEHVPCSRDGCSFAHKKAELRKATFDLFGTVLAAGDQPGALDFDIQKKADGKIYRFGDDSKLYKVN
jgi:hypothetical protein